MKEDMFDMNNVGNWGKHEISLICWSFMVARVTLFCFWSVKFSKAFGLCDFNREPMLAREVVQNLELRYQAVMLLGRIPQKWKPDCKKYHVPAPYTYIKSSVLP